MNASAAGLLYVVGPGRGGSTLFERVLNSAPGSFALGEFHCLWRLDPDRILCACGRGFARCGFWQSVMSRSGIGAQELARWRQLESEVARSGLIARHGFSVTALRRHAGVVDYLALQETVLANVRMASGCTTLIDSSKAGPRAWLVATDPDAVIVHLHRDAVDVLTSWRRPKWDPSLGAPMHKPAVASAALDWWKVERLAQALARQRPVHRIDYDAFVAQPRAVIDASLAGAIAGGVAWLDERRVDGSAPYHSLNGNPDRFDSGPITIAARERAVHLLPAPDRIAVRTVGGLLDLMLP